MPAAGNRIGVAVPGELAAADDPSLSGVSFPEAVLPVTLMTHPMMVLMKVKGKKRRADVSILHG